ncbi:rhodanese-like domain-containing protein [Cytobacillus massiliigabonensis]|uniref:rhodanese-like domain-containing protein n=1 Tax=Cytobacillus massiliigabonensis TaxID=1871011 RepID=UPI000C82A754|nr:rhodanese-like domain-containing protein [Cytobacillus massiliigabonensis]
MKIITPAELDNRQKKNEELFVLDVRSEEKYDHYHIKEQHIHSVNIEKTHIFDVNDTESISSLPKDKEIIITCTTGNSAKKCAEILAEKEYSVTLLEGGITAWKEYKAKK